MPSKPSGMLGSCSGFAISLSNGRPRFRNKICSLGESMEMIVCPNCGESIGEDEVICPFCDEDLVELGDEEEDILNEEDDDIIDDYEEEDIEGSRFDPECEEFPM